MNSNKKESLKVEYVPKEFKNGDDCPFCSGQLYDISKGGLNGDEFQLKCTNAECFFNRVDFK